MTLTGICQMRLGSDARILEFGVFDKTEPSRRAPSDVCARDRHGHIASARLCGDAVSVIVRERVAGAGFDPGG